MIRDLRSDQLAKNFRNYPEVLLVSEALAGIKRNPHQLLKDSAVWALKKIKAPEAWKIARGDSKVIVAIIDTGVDYNHPDLATNLVRRNDGDGKEVIGVNLLDSRFSAWDDVGHGTAMASIIGAQENDDFGVSGVAPGVSLLPIKFSGAEEQIDNFHLMIRAIDVAIENAAKIINLSVSFLADVTEDAWHIQVMRDAVERARKANVLMIVAAGNNGIDLDRNKNRLTIPAGIQSENLIVVTASHSEDAIDSRCNRGKETVDLAAPGVFIETAAPRGSFELQSYGSSLSTAYVTGAAALVFSLHPDWTPKDVKDAILSSVDKFESMKGLVRTGGRLNVLRALKSRKSEI